MDGATPQLSPNLPFPQPFIFSRRTTRAISYQYNSIIETNITIIQQFEIGKVNRCNLSHN